MDIRKLAYELYKIDWKDSHGIIPRVEKDNLKLYSEYLTDFDSSYSYEDYLEDYGYYGQLYVCFNEFLDYEYQDVAYMKGLFSNDKLFQKYLKDRNEE